MFILILSDPVITSRTLPLVDSTLWIVSICSSIYLQDLLHTTKHKDALLGEQSGLQKGLSEWKKKVEDCQKEGETKQQQLQELQKEIEENKAKLKEQEMVLGLVLQALFPGRKQPWTLPHVSVVPILSLGNQEEVDTNFLTLAVILVNPEDH